MLSQGDFRNVKEIKKNRNKPLPQVNYNYEKNIFILNNIYILCQFSFTNINDDTMIQTFIFFIFICFLLIDIIFALFYMKRL